MSTTSTTGPAHRASSYSNVPNVQVSAANDIDYVYRDTPLVAARSSPGGGGQSTSSRSPGPTRARFEHIGYVLKGRMALRMDDGTEREFGQGETIHMPPGHDAWIVGDEACVLLGDQSWHGDGGPLPITRYLALELTEIAAAGMQALEAVGFPVVEDHNRPGAVGAHEDDSQGRATPLLASAIARLRTLDASGSPLSEDEQRASVSTRLGAAHRRSAATPFAGRISGRPL